AQVVLAEVGMSHQHVDHGRDQHGIGRPVLADALHEGVHFELRQDDVRAAGQGDVPDWTGGGEVEEPRYIDVPEMAGVSKHAQIGQGAEVDCPVRHGHALRVPCGPAGIEDDIQV